MTKTLKHFLEAAKPFVNKNLRPEDQEKTKPLTVDHLDDRNGNGDEVFKASNIKTKNIVKHHGYKPGDDAKVYEGKKLIGNQNKLDKNNNGKIDAEDFKLLKKEEASAAVENATGEVNNIRNGKFPEQAVLNISESNYNLMSAVFEGLSEENQRKFLDWCQTPEGVDLMLDFSIINRVK